MKLFVSQPMHPHTRFLKVAILVSGKTVDELPLSEEQAAQKLKHGSVVAFDNAGSEFYEYRAIAKIILEGTSFLGGTNFYQAKVDEYLESAENHIIQTGTPIFNMIFGKQAVDMDMFKTRDAAIKDYVKSLD